MLGMPTISTEVMMRQVSYIVRPSNRVFMGLDIAGLQEKFKELTFVFFYFSFSVISL